MGYCGVIVHRHCRVARPQQQRPQLLHRDSGDTEQIVAGWLDRNQVLSLRLRHQRLSVSFRLS